MTNLKGKMKDDFFLLIMHLNFIETEKVNWFIKTILKLSTIINYNNINEINIYQILSKILCENVRKHTKIIFYFITIILNSYIVFKNNKKN